MPLNPSSSHGAPDVVDELRRQSRLNTLLSLLAIVVAVIALFH
jgi:hypothetical protein